jgi:hypothetical protein
MQKLDWLGVLLFQRLALLSRCILAIICQALYVRPHPPPLTPLLVV